MKNQSDLAYENSRLSQTITIAQAQLAKAKAENEENKEAILTAKEELRENAAHSISSLWGAEGFEALAELSQYMNPVTDKIADYEATEHKIELLENLIKTPYFARIDFKFDDDDTAEQIYIGRFPLMKEDNFEMVVYDWRSPVASIFYRFVTGNAYYQAPGGKITGELLLKRQYEITGGVLSYYFDADVQIFDAILRKQLSQNTSPRMKTIVETIQKEQDVIIRDMQNDLMIVQGVAGSGKTSIALHRAAYLMYQGLSNRLSANNIVIISPNTLFEQYIAHVLPALGEQNVNSMIFDEIMVELLNNDNIQSKNEFLENLITNNHEYDWCKECITFKTSHVFTEIIDQFILDLPERLIPFEDVYFKGTLVATKEALKDRIVSGRKQIPLGIRLKHLEEYILSLIYEINPIHQSETYIIKKELEKFTCLQVETLYRKLFLNKDYLYGLLKGADLPDSMDDIFRLTQHNLSQQVLCYDDAIALTYLHIKLFGVLTYRNIKQVVIDEAQDYYPMQYEIFALLFPNAKFTILGDIYQTLEKSEDATFYEQIKQILHKKKASMITLDKSFRCTNEILNYSAKFLDRPLEIKSFNRSGSAPKIDTADNLKELESHIISKVNHCIQVGYRSIGLLCKTQKNARLLYEHINKAVSVRLIENGRTADMEGVLVLPIYMSKGLEFDAVLVCDASKEHYDSQNDQKLLYIACTRALHHLSLFCLGSVNPLL